MPAQLTSFIGREEEIDEVASLLSSARLVTLAGAGGSGKTRLSQEIGASVIDDYADGIWFIGLAALSDQNMLRPTVAETFDVGEDALLEFLQGKSVLIILDNCEHVIVGAATLVQWLLTSSDVSVIATSRESLNLTGERMFQVPPLPVPVDSAAHEILSDCPSVQLFQERAQAAKPDFELMASNAGAVNQIVRRLDGIPLAIELAASRVKLMQPAEIANRLDDCFKILSGGPVDVLPHHQTIERTIDWSYDMLDLEQQMLFRQVSVFRGGFTLDACGAVMGTEDEFEALDAIGELVDKSLVRTMPSGEEMRYYYLSDYANTPPPGSLRTSQWRRVADTRVSIEISLNKQIPRFTVQTRLNGSRNWTGSTITSEPHWLGVWALAMPISLSALRPPCGGSG